MTLLSAFLKYASVEMMLTSVFALLWIIQNESLEIMQLNLLLPLPSVTNEFGIASWWPMWICYGAHVTPVQDLRNQWVGSREKQKSNIGVGNKWRRNFLLLFIDVDIFHCAKSIRNIFITSWLSIRALFEKRRSNSHDKENRWKNHKLHIELFRSSTDWRQTKTCRVRWVDFNL